MGAQHETVSHRSTSWYTTRDICPGVTPWGHNMRRLVLGRLRMGGRGGGGGGKRRIVLTRCVPWHSEREREREREREMYLYR